MFLVDKIFSPNWCLCECCASIVFMHLQYIVSCLQAGILMLCLHQIVAVVIA